jgi:hypothetical protein
MVPEYALTTAPENKHKCFKARNQASREPTFPNPAIWYLRVRFTSQNVPLGGWSKGHEKEEDIRDGGAEVGVWTDAGNGFVLMKLIPAEWYGQWRNIGPFRGKVL